MGKTRIRVPEFGDRAKLVQALFGLDVNSLYCHCISQDLPAKWCVERTAEKKFAGNTPAGFQSYEFLMYYAWKHKVKISHQFNS